MATHSNILARKIQRTEEPGGLQFMGLKSQTQLYAWSQLAFLDYLLCPGTAQDAFHTFTVYNHRPQ